MPFVFPGSLMFAKSHNNANLVDSRVLINL
jgi:hypothetical protein